MLIIVGLAVFVTFLQPSSRRLGQKIELGGSIRQLELVLYSVLGAFD